MKKQVEINLEINRLCLPNTPNVSEEGKLCMVCSGAKYVCLGIVGKNIVA